MISSVMSQGLYGMQKSQQAMAVNAQQIAQSGQSSPAAATSTPDNRVTESRALENRVEKRDMVDNAVELKQQQNLFDASAKMVAVGSRTLGSLLDATA